MEMYSHWMLRVCRHIIQQDIQNYTKIDQTDQRAYAVKILLLLGPEQNGSHFANEFSFALYWWK